MAKISYYDAREIYKNLTYLCDKILANNLWEKYLIYTLKINSDIKKLLSFLDGLDLVGEYRTWMEAIPSFEAVYEKLCYIASSKEEKTMRNANDQCERITFNQ